MNRSGLAGLLAVVPILMSLSIASVEVLAQECGLVSEHELNQVLPDAAPWRTLSGGSVGSCQFIGSERPHMLSVTQMVRSSPTEAAEYVRGFRESASKDHSVQKGPELGEEGFHYRASPDDGSGSAFFVGHRDRVVVIFTLSYEGEVAEEELAAVIPLVQSVLANAQNEEALEAATNCPWFDKDVVGRLFGGVAYEVGVFGETMCMANVGSKVLMVTILETDDPESTVEAMSGDCRSEVLPDLGAARLEYECTTGNPRAIVRVAGIARVFEFSFVPNAEPSGKERSMLVELAKMAIEKD